MEHQGHVRDVQAARCHVCCHQDAVGVGFEAVQRLGER